MASVFLRPYAFVQLMEELGIECQVGDPAKIRVAEPRKQKHDRRDADLILKQILLGFANKKYETDFYVEVRRESTETYHLRDFTLHIDSQDSPSHNRDIRAKRESSSRTNLSQSEHDWAFAKRALARGDDPCGGACIRSSSN